MNDTPVAKPSSAHWIVLVAVGCTFCAITLFSAVVLSAGTSFEALIAERVEDIGRAIKVLLGCAVFSITWAITDKVKLRWRARTAAAR